MSGEAAAQAQPILTLRIVQGLHQGARLQVAEGDMLVIGSGDDCDLILSDAGVANHHCILTSQESRLVVRAMDGVLRLNAAEYAPGTAVPLMPESVVELGEAAFQLVSLIPTGEPIARAIAEPVANTADPGRVREMLRAVPRWQWAAAGGVVAVVILACALRLTGSGISRPAHAAIQDTQVADSGEKRPGEAVAHDVAEVLRLSGLACRAQYTGEGTVTVTGHLGDPKALGTVVQSRAMREIVGLKRVLAVNLDHPGGPASGTPVDGTRIVSVIASHDPYIVTADGSRYYVGAALPQGGRLSGVREGEVLVERNGRVEHWKLPGSASDDSAHNHSGDARSSVAEEFDSSRGSLVKSSNRHPITMR